MYKHILDSWGGESYSAPTLDMLTVEVEKGFAQSPNPDNYSDEGGLPGKDGLLDDNTYGDF